MYGNLGMKLAAIFLRDGKVRLTAVLGRVKFGWLLDWMDFVPILWLTVSWVSWCGHISIASWVYICRIKIAERNSNQMESALSRCCWFWRFYRSYLYSHAQYDSFQCAWPTFFLVQEISTPYLYSILTLACNALQHVRLRNYVAIFLKLHLLLVFQIFKSEVSNLTVA